MKLFKIKNAIPLFLLLALFVLKFSSCKKDKEEPLAEVEVDDDGLSSESEQIELLKTSHEEFEAGRFKTSLDTNNLPPKDQYMVLFKSDFQPPYCETIEKGSDKQSGLDVFTRGAKAKITNEIEKVVPSTAITDWFNVLSSGFLANLTPNEVKNLLKNKNVKCVDKNFAYKEYGSHPIVFKKTSYGLYIHKTKKVPSSSKKRIWIIDVKSDFNHFNLNVDKKNCKFFTSDHTMRNNLHGSNVGNVAGSSVIPVDGFRGVAEGAKIVFANIDLNTFSILKALEYVWLNSKKGDIVNCSWGADVDENQPHFLEIENNLLDFYGWDQPVVICAGNENTYASKITPARLGMKYKDNPKKYNFIYVVANIEPVGSDYSIKNGTCNFKLSTDYFSNYGRAIRYGLVGYWRKPLGGYCVGTSFSAPALCGILYHHTPSVYRPKIYSKKVKHKRGRYTYYYRVPKIY